MSTPDFSKYIRLATIQKLAKHTEQEDPAEARRTIQSFLAANWNALCGSDFETLADTKGLSETFKDDDLYSTCLETYTNGMYRGFVAGIAAMEILNIMCDEEPEEDPEEEELKELPFR